MMIMSHKMILKNNESLYKKMAVKVIKDARNECVNGHNVA